jgi:polysaccharide export outer membrane protein
MFKIHAGVTQEYILGPGDVLSITDTSEDKPETTIAPILPDGTAVISYTGVIPAAGRSLREMNELVNEQAKKWYVNPQIIVNLAKQRATTVYLLGELVHPGLYSSGSSEGGMPGGGGRESNSSSSASDSAEGEGSPSGAAGMGGQSSLTLSGALQMAGGLKETADVRHLRVTRLAPKQTFQIDLWKLMIDGDVTEDIALQPGDVVYVPKGGADYEPSDFGMLVNNRPKVRVLGSVKQPGLLAMAPDDDVLSAIAKAGGFENTAATRYVVLARTNRDGTVTTEKINIKKGYIDGHSSARQKIRPGDVIIVKRSASKTVGVIAGRTLPSVMTGMMMAVLYTRINSNNNN